MPDTKAMSATDISRIRTQITGCQELANSIRSKAWELNNREDAKEPEKPTKEPSDVGQELRDKLAMLHDILSDASSSLHAFV